MSVKQVHQKSVTFISIGTFLDKGFTFQPYVCNGCHDLWMMSISLNVIGILDIRFVDYRGIINGISKSDTADLLQNADLTGEKGVLGKFWRFITTYEISKEITTFGNI